MRAALAAAEEGRKAGDYAIGACIVDPDGRIVASSANRSHRDQSPIAHAEVIVLLEACKQAGSRHLPGYVLYTTHEPCPMCASVAVWSKVSGIVYGARQQDIRDYRGAGSRSGFLWRSIQVPCKTIVENSDDHIEIVPEFMREECLALFHD